MSDPCSKHQIKGFAFSYTCLNCLGGGEGGSEYQILGDFFCNSRIYGRNFRDSQISGNFAYQS